MTNVSLPTLSRRAFLAGSAATATGALLAPIWPNAADAAPLRDFKLRCSPGSAQLSPGPSVATKVWSYNGTVPGSEIRVKQGERLRVVVENELEQNTTVHWHGIRLPNAMDGVPNVTQEPIAPGGNFVYEFDAVDAGTFWYHPHERSSEQVGRGLYGPLIVEEREPIRVDRDVTWVLDDWRLGPSGEIAAGFGDLRDAVHGGRIGNRITINGRPPEDFKVRTGERIRLRLLNTANARIFGLDFAEHRPSIIALDGQPVTPHQPDGLLVLGPGMRIDLVLDMTEAPGSRVTIRDRFFEDYAYDLIDLAYADTPLRDKIPDWPIALPANPLSEPDLTKAERHELIFNGGMMGGAVMQEMGASMIAAPTMRRMMQSGSIWFINGVAASGLAMKPFLTLERDKSHVLAMTNATGWEHPMHLHGYSFRVISRNGKPTQHQEWQDTVLMMPRERVEIALVADNPGDWMFHCHILEHQASGMVGVIRVA